MKNSALSNRLPVFWANGFTLIELLVSIAVIAVLGAILVPTIGKVRENANRSVCASNLRELSTASRLYSNDHGGALVGLRFPSEVEPAGAYWFRQIYPYLKDDDKLSTTKVFQCPSDQEAVDAFEEGSYEWSTISYLLLKGDPTWTNSIQINEPSNSPQFIDAEQPATADYRSGAKLRRLIKGDNPEWRHGNGVNVAYWDGSVVFVEEPTFEKVFRISDK